jgi:hypothetical protein
MTARDAIYTATNTHNTVILQYKLKGGKLKHRPVAQHMAHKWTTRCAENPNVEYCSIIDRDELASFVM